MCAKTLWKKQSKERERERERECVCECVCDREKEREKEKERQPLKQTSVHTNKVIRSLESNLNVYFEGIFVS